MEVNSKRHFILYAKHHYVEGDLMEDLKHITGDYCMIFPEQMDNCDIYQVVLGVFLDIIPHDRLNYYLQDMFKPRFEEGKGFAYFDDNCPIERAIKNMISALGQLPIIDADGNKLLELGVPDPEILPLKNPEKWATGKFKN